MSATGEVQPRVEFDLSSKVDLSDSMGTYFKSSFAKSMALSSDQQSKSLDCSALNASLRARADTEFGLAAARGRGGPGPGPVPGVDRDCTAKVRRDSCIPRGGPPAQARPAQPAQHQGAVATRTKEVSVSASRGRGRRPNTCRQRLAGPTCPCPRPDVPDMILGPALTSSGAPRPAPPRTGLRAGAAYPPRFVFREPGGRSGLLLDDDVVPHASRPVWETFT
ncbi:hypothetical protein KUF71_010404 [Frankliniella fusca]|uniref:Uncharacterized protein n=1 Tax=Frankliniella fusca TaxID=407009 RepID=A0AAE1HH14_9NEOP|nr:hypothetical protein KUF71_010404 [Frankliniella fusca]